MLKVILPPWILLGFYRGVNKYNFDYKKKCNIYENYHKYYEKPEYFYMANISYGIFGIIMYVNPVTFPAVFAKEIYRLEVNIRGLNEKKKTDFYNDIL